MGLVVCRKCWLILFRHGSKFVQFAGLGFLLPNRCSIRLLQVQANMWNKQFRPHHLRHSTALVRISRCKPALRSTSFRVRFLNQSLSEAKLPEQGASTSTLSNLTFNIRRLPCIQQINYCVANVTAFQMVTQRIQPPLIHIQSHNRPRVLHQICQLHSFASWRRCCIKHFFTFQDGQRGKLGFGRLLPGSNTSPAGIQRLHQQKLSSQAPNSLSRGKGFFAGEHLSLQALG